MAAHRGRGRLADRLRRGLLLVPAAGGLVVTWTFLALLVLVSASTLDAGRGWFAWVVLVAVVAVPPVVVWRRSGHHRSAARLVVLELVLVAALLPVATLATDEPPSVRHLGRLQVVSPVRLAWLAGFAVLTVALARQTWLRRSLYVGVLCVTSTGMVAAGAVHACPTYEPDAAIYPLPNGLERVADVSSRTEFVHDSYTRTVTVRSTTAEPAARLAVAGLAADGWDMDAQGFGTAGELHTVGVTAGPTVDLADVAFSRRHDGALCPDS